MLNLERLTASEAERAAHASGDALAARLYARIADLQRALGQSVAALEAIAYDMGDRHRPRAAREALAQIQDVTQIEGITK